MTCIPERHVEFEDFGCGCKFKLKITDWPADLGPPWEGGYTDKVVSVVKKCLKHKEASYEEVKKKHLCSCSWTTEIREQKPRLNYF